ncbi:MAG: WecB/TagA/CpsF family glycosyltransferase [Roseovarius sp.]|nr:WecB/TagA/CpsF family glycosyltransferase [Roseovarius sp.]
MELRAADITIRIAPRDRAALEAEVARRLAAREGFALATVNLDHMVKLRHDPAFRAAYARHDLIVADGNPIVWLSRLARRPVGLVPGSDMVVPLARAAQAAGASVALVGGTEASLRGASERLMAQVPGLRIVAQIAPPMGFDSSGAQGAEVIEALGASGAGLCLLALGAPKQEIFAARAHAALPHLGLAGIGAGLDFLSGAQRRAPLWMRRLALEWLWRMLLQPRRLIPRYARCALILPGLAVQAWRQRR